MRRVVHTLLRVHQISQRIFRIVESAGKSNAEDWRVVVEHVRVAKRRQICRFSYFPLASSLCAPYPNLISPHVSPLVSLLQPPLPLTIHSPRPHKPNNPRNHRTNQQLIIRHDGSPLFIRVNLHESLVPTLPTIVWPVTDLPVRVSGLGEFEARGRLVPVRARGLHGTEVAVRIPSHRGLGVELVLRGPSDGLFVGDLLLGDVGHRGVGAEVCGMRWEDGLVLCYIMRRSAFT